MSRWKLGRVRNNDACALEVFWSKQDGSDGYICLAIACLLGGAYSGDVDQRRDPPVEGATLGDAQQRSELGSCGSDLGDRVTEMQTDRRLILSWRRMVFWVQPVLFLAYFPHCPNLLEQEKAVVAGYVD